MAHTLALPDTARTHLVSIETRQLRYFVAVAEEGHFGRAAERLHITQPSLSQQVKQLERELNTELLLRSTRNVRLTSAGSLLLARGRRILDDLESLEASTRRVGAGLEGVLRVGFTGAATYGLMPRVMREAASEFPDIQLDVTGEHLTPGLIRALESNRLDIAVLRPPVDGADVAFDVVATEPLIAAVSAESPLASRPFLEVSDFAQQDYVSFPPDSAVAQVVARSFDKKGVSPRLVASVSETSTLLSLVAAGVGIALVPESARSIHLGGTVYLPVTDAPNVTLAIAWRSNDASPTVHRFVPFLKDVLTKGDA